MENLISALKLVMENEDVKKVATNRLYCLHPIRSFTPQKNRLKFRLTYTHPGLLGHAPLKNNSSMQQTAINE